MRVENIHRHGQNCEGGLQVDVVWEKTRVGEKSWSLKPDESDLRYLSAM